MLTDPLSVTYDGAANNFYRISQGPNGATYQTANGLITIVTKQNVTAKRMRREFRITQTKVAADPISAVNANEGCSVYLVVDEPKNGVFTDAEIDKLADSISSFQGTAAFAQVLRGEY